MPGLFEFQLGLGTTVEDALTHGLRQWSHEDLAPLLDAIDSGGRCPALEAPASSGRPARRAVLGPVFHVRPGPLVDDGEHPFCPCCLLTRSSIDVFRSLFGTSGVHAVRLFAKRTAQGAVVAECRVNGEEYPIGADALRTYAGTWPGAGFELRSQYVVFHDVLAG